MDRRGVLQSVAALLAFGAAPSAWTGNKNVAQDEQATDAAGTSSNRLPGANLNHVLIYVPDVEQAKKFYAEKFGFREVFSFPKVGNKSGFTYLQISQNTFLELQPASDEHPPGIGHIGLAVANADDAVKTLRERGLNSRDPRTSEQTQARIVSGVQGTPGVTFELLEFPPDSLVRKAMNSWR